MFVVQRVMVVLASALLISAGAACSKPEGSTTLPTTTRVDVDGGFPTGDERPTLIVSPDDMLTDVALTPLVVKVGSGIVSSETLKSLASGVRLRTYPELQDVAIRRQLIWRTVRRTDPPQRTPWFRSLTTTLTSESRPPMRSIHLAGMS